MNNILEEKYKLSRNPFPPAAAGIDVERDVYIPHGWKEEIGGYYETLSRGGGVKAFPVIGEYGSGKTVLLKVLLKEFFEERRIMPFYFENPGVQFYDLANTLMRTLGRLEFSKALWEICKQYDTDRGTRRLSPLSLGKLLHSLKTRGDREEKARELSRILRNQLRLTDDEEVAYRLALIVVETATKPYFEYRDFTAGKKSSLVAEKEEPKYFKAIINSIMRIYNVEGVAFLMDEFEDVAIPRRMSRSKSYEYLATLRHLIDISQEENFWIIIAMTHQAATSTEEMNPPLWDRFTNKGTNALELEPLTTGESKELIKWWLNRARKKGDLTEYKDKLFPFPEEIEDLLESSPEIRLPRSLVKLSFFAIAEAQGKGLEPPFPVNFMKEISERIFPPMGETHEKTDLHLQVDQNE